MLIQQKRTQSPLKRSSARLDSTRTGTHTVAWGCGEVLCEEWGWQKCSVFRAERKRLVKKISERVERFLEIVECGTRRGGRWWVYSNGIMKCSRCVQDHPGTECEFEYCPLLCLLFLGFPPPEPEARLSVSLYRSSRCPVPHLVVPISDRSDCSPGKCSGKVLSVVQLQHCSASAYSGGANAENFHFIIQFGRK